MAMDNATKILQLRQARDGKAEIPIQSVFTEKEQQGLNKVLPQLEGQTEKLKNPHDPGQLSWATWIIARLGGWKGYDSSRPPGMKTLKRGLDKFYIMLWAWDLDSS
jgi:hypothetical protein